MIQDLRLLEFYSEGNLRELAKKITLDNAMLNYLDNTQNNANNPNENYTLANPVYDYKTGWLIGDIETSHTIKFTWEYQFTDIISLELGFANIQRMDELINTLSIQMNVDY